MNMFDLEKAKNGAKLCTRDGKPARIICWNRKDETYPIIAITGENDENINSYTLEGRCDQDVETSQDLIVVPERKVGWINIYKEFEYVTGEIVHPTKEEALDSIDEDNFGYNDYITTIKIEWDE